MLTTYETEKTGVALGAFWVKDRKPKGAPNRVMVSAKLSRAFLGFHAMRIYPDLAGGSFVAVFQRDAVPFASGEELRGGLVVDRDYVMTGMTLIAQSVRAKGPSETFAA